ncbi:MAG: YdbL family protein [Gammaproteobacteria bacterium]|nr:YdbL family protein [Gammaproteobacteria bacterium]MDH5618660.1 YdbL family protein [Gammaproteobacteria bacterium]
MRKIAISLSVLITVFVVACVTINVYFPEAAAVEAADRIIDKVRGEESGEPTTRLRPDDSDRSNFAYALASGLGQFLIGEANAQEPVDFDKPSAEKAALENSLAARFPALRVYLDSGAIGLTDSGLLEIRDRNLVPLKDRNTVVQLVAAQNNDWNALYAEIARLNNHPEWQDSIRRTFAERWVAKADKGWYYREGGVWKQK